MGTTPWHRFDGRAPRAPPRPRPARGPPRRARPPPPFPV